MEYEKYISLDTTERIEKSIALCGKDMQDASWHGVRLLAFTEYVRHNSRRALAERLAENEKNGIIYHRDPVNYTGDYDGYSTIEEIISLLESGEKSV